jgi:hypothetical protein
MSRRKRLAMAASILGAGALLANRQRPTSVVGADPSMKTPSSSKKIRRGQRVIDSGAKTMVDTPVKTTVDTDALPREVKEKASEVRATSDKMKKKVLKRKKEGKLSPTMPKNKSQVTSDFGLDMFGGAKTGKMIKARGGGMARMKPTKLY